MLVFLTHFVYVLNGLGAFVRRSGKTRVTSAKRGKTWNWRQARENLKPSAGERESGAKQENA